MTVKKFDTELSALYYGDCVFKESFNKLTASFEKG